MSKLNLATRSGSIRLLFLVTACFTLPYLTLAGARPQESGEGVDPTMVAEGREVYGLACVQCHGLDQAMIQRKPAEGWRRTIYSMIGRGAPVLPDEIEPLTAYLTSTYGPTSSLPIFDEGTSDRESLPAGGEAVVAACGACHAVNLVFGSRKSESDWRATVAQMISLGATVTESEQQMIIDYLTEYFGSQ